MKMRMNIGTAFLLAVMCVSSVGVSAQKRSEKRGVGENSFGYPEEIQALTDGVCWYYNWGILPTPTIKDQVGPDTKMNYIPMLWNGKFNEASVREYLNAHPGTGYLLGFNEPNFTAQANMTPTEAAAKWPVVQQIADDFDLKLVGPALNYSPNAPYQDPKKWLDEFKAALTPEAWNRIDYLALHCYMNGADGMMAFIDEIAERYGKKIWLTEFCAWDGNVTAVAQKNTMVAKVEALELSPNVEKYAWFKARDAYQAPYYTLLKYRNESQGIPAGTLTDLGKVYVYMSPFDLDYYYAMGEMIPATNYVKSKYVNVGVSTEEGSPNKLEIEYFGGSCTVDYLVDVPEDGTYPLYIRMASVPVLGNPTFEVYVNDEKVGSQELEPTGSITNWQVRSMSLDLSMGKQRITVKSVKNANIKLAWLSLGQLPASISSGQTLEHGVSVLNEEGCLTVEANMPVKKILLNDMCGKTVQSVSGSNRISTASLEAGIYLVTIYLQDGTAKTIKQLIR